MTHPPAADRAAPGDSLERLLDRLPYPAFLLAAALLASLINLFFFCPRFTLWRGLDLPAARVEPDIDRAVDTLAQLKDPFVRIENPYSRVIHWRLLFPVLGHALHLPPGLFLALPHLGCLAALALIAHVICREVGSRRLALLATMLSAGGAWFFVATGWLSYNDSWLMLGLVASAFLRSRLALGAAILLCPWIDERILLLLPVNLALRSYLLYADGSRWQALIDGAWAAAAAVPYLGIRLNAYLSGNDPVTDAYVQVLAEQVIPLWQYVLGAWMGLRGLWVYVAAFCVLACRLRSTAWNVLVMTGLAATFVVSLLIANDFGRSISAFLPVGLAGIVLCHRHAPRLLARWLPWVLAVNLLLPASHVVGRDQYPIYYFYSELARWSLPPDYLTPEFYNRRGLEGLQRGELERAWSEFETALKLDANFVAARGNRALILVARRAFEPAIQELNAVIASGQNLPDALHLRGKCFEATGRVAAAINDYRQALQVAPPDWPSRAELQQRLAQLQQSQG